MVKEPSRKCSHCGKNGHNSRTCPSNSYININHCGNRNIGNGNGEGNGFKLFGVTITDKEAADSIKKSMSMGNLAAYSSSGGHGNDVVPADVDRHDHEDPGYLSDGLIHNKRRKAAHERKRGKPWTEDEHLTFLAGLSKLGKGDWRGISMKYVTSRTPSQVASHAQKYFLRHQSSNDKKKRRTSLFDMPFRHFDDVAPQRYGFSPMVTSSSKARSPRALAEIKPADHNLPSEILNGFPHLSLNNYTAHVPPAATAGHIGTNHQRVPYGVGIPGNLESRPMVNFGILPTNMPNMYGNVENVVPVVGTHPSGIPSPRSRPSSPSNATGGALSTADKKDGLELKIGMPQSQRGPKISSPESGAIRVT